VVTSAALEDPLGVRDVDEELVELVCADDELLAAEFEAIIAANWPPSDTPSSEGATADATDDISPTPASTRRPARWMPSRSTRRQRSPPSPDHGEQMT
jgi:hypothetical protein